VLSHQVDHLLEQQDFFVPCSQSPADHDALPGPRTQRIGDQSHDVVAAVEAYKARLDADVVASEYLDALG
jgi:hypothetical protein